jgi:hypothetical protein
MQVNNSFFSSYFIFLFYLLFVYFYFYFYFYFLIDFVAVEDSLKTYKLLEALRSGKFRNQDFILLNRILTFSTLIGDTATLQTLISTYTLPLPSSASSSTLTSQTSSQHNLPSPLILSVQCATTNTVEFIISNFVGKNIDLNQKDQLGNTALHYASKGGRIDVIELLLRQKNINDTIMNVDGKQPIDLAKNQEIANILKGN